MIFQLPNNPTSFFDVWNYINSLTDVGQGGVLGIISLIVILFVLFLGMKQFRTENAFFTAMMITSILGILERLMGWINDGILYICIILLLISIYVLTKESSNYEP
jgi:hypothetical protein